MGDRQPRRRHRSSTEAFRPSFPSSLEAEEAPWELQQEGVVEVEVHHQKEAQELWAVPERTREVLVAAESL